ncbi:GMC oxidoreductase [Rathayibacter sp. AY1A3]|uniref:GMC oxidoreductase n=1 Tax=Rathayibacter sp. AY1A3 TaxID=2080521 RepID=UPI000CE7A103|nr:GMC oxidoreductase [Rathayibacter sp. AY1A3]PPF37948.1 choline dehydrogenase [Rathayibacter sp. AY1A3]
MPETTTPVDVLLIGSGIMGAALARGLRDADPALRILMIDGGPAVGSVAGLHLHDSEEPEIWSRYNQRVATGVQGMYTGADVTPDITDDLRSVAPGMYNLSAMGEDARAMPASAVAWNVGGMGVHWTAATPWPAGDEAFGGGDAEQWEQDLDRARTLLDVQESPLGPTEPGRLVLEVLEEAFGPVSAQGRGPQPMPMAVGTGSTGPLVRTGPSRIFPPIAQGGDDAFELRPGTLATAIRRDGDRAVGVRVREIATGREYDIDARTTVVCADAVRTPQLLFASGIRPVALGRYLNEHAFVTARVVMDLERFGVARESLPRLREGEFATDSLWLPQNGEAQPFHGQIMNSVFIDEQREPFAYSVGLSFYTPVESRPENRLVFSEEEADVTGLPRLRVDFEYSDRDRELIAAAQERVREIAERFGAFDPSTECAVLAPGSSLHLTGTVRSGDSDDGASVCDPTGRVWGVEGLYLAGNGVIPTPIVCNATLTGTITAVRATRAVLAELAAARV